MDFIPDISNHRFGILGSNPAMRLPHGKGRVGQTVQYRLLHGTEDDPPIIYCNYVLARWCPSSLAFSWFISNITRVD